MLYGDTRLPPRFWTKVRIDESGCWRWTGCTNGIGYGKTNIGVRQVYAHRWLFEVTYGPIPRGYVLDHLCRTPSCCNPRHLETVTQRENVLRGVGPFAANARKTHCPQGHEYTLANTYTWKRMRRCRTCNRTSKRKETHV